jgi:hypothetical protein
MKQEGRWNMGKESEQSQKVHSRIKNDGPIIQDLKEGILLPVTKLVQDDPDLFLGFRDQYIKLYYKCHVLLEIRPARSGYKVSFDLNHAKYTEDRETKLKELGDPKVGMEIVSQLRDGKEKQYLERTITERDSRFWAQAGKLLKDMIHDFFDPDKKQNYVSGEWESNKHEDIEKQHQQLLVLSNQCQENGFIVYDIEYREPNSSGTTGRYDLLALQVKNHEVKTLWILELKSTLKACKDKYSKKTGKPTSKGVKEHYKDMYGTEEKTGYIQRRDLLEQRWRDAEMIVHAYQDLGLPGWNDVPTFAEDHDFKCGFILTGTAAGFKGADQYPVCILKDENDFQIYEPKKAKP